MKPLNLSSFSSAAPTGNSRRSFLKIASLSIAATAVAQSAEKTKSVAASGNFPPIGDIHAHVCGIHFYSGDMNRQIIAEHYCSHFSDEVLQCVIYDSNKPGARLIGVEYIVSAKIFDSLPAEEKKLWHSHNYGSQIRCANRSGHAGSGGERSGEGAHRHLRKNLAFLAG
jgi:Protein of unknown function (DUF1264)